MFSQRYAFVYVNIFHMEVDDAVVSQKHNQLFVLIYLWFKLIYRLLSDPIQIMPQIIETRVKIKC